MAAHVAANIAFAHPVQRPLQEILPVCAAFDVGAPLLDVRVLAVAELGLRKRHERPGVDGVQQLLVVEWHTCDVDSLKPLFDLGLCAFTLVDEQFRVPNFGLLVGGKAVKVLWIAAIHDGELVRNEPSDARNPLLAVQYLELVLADFVEVDQAERVAIEKGVNDRLLFLASAIRLDIVPLVLRLNGKLSAQSVESLSLQLVVHKPIADVRHGNVGSQRSFHFYLPLAGLAARRWRMMRRA